MENNVEKIKNYLGKKSCSWWFAYPPNVYVTQEGNKNAFFDNLSFWASNPLDKHNVGLFIYIPFCSYYCNFCIYPKWNPENVEKYVDDLIKDLVKTSQIFKNNNITLDNIYIGGGTPTFLSKELLERIFKSLYENFDLTFLKQFAIESTPDSLDDEKIDLILKYGVSRIGFGLQSANNEILKNMKRFHTIEELADRVKFLNRKNFYNIHVDFIVGLPEEDIYSKDYIKNAVNYFKLINPSHINLYSYTDSGKRMDLIRKTPHSDFNIGLVLFKLKKELLDLGFFINNEYNGKNMYENDDLPDIPGYNRNSEGKYFKTSVVGIGASAISFLYGKDFFLTIFTPVFENENKYKFSLLKGDEIIRRKIISDLFRSGKIYIHHYKKRFNIDIVAFVGEKVFEKNILKQCGEYLEFCLDRKKFNASDFFDIVYEYFYSDEMKNYILKNIDN